MSIIWFALSVVGLTNIIVHGKIFNPVRKLLKKILPAGLYSVFECYECMGFWAGLLCGYLLVTDAPLLVVLCGFSGSVISQTYTDVIYLLRSKIDFVVSDEEDNG